MTAESNQADRTIFGKGIPGMDTVVLIQYVPL